LDSSLPKWLNRLKGDSWLEEKQTELNQKRDKYLPKILVLWGQFGRDIIDKGKVDELLILPVEDTIKKVLKRVLELREKGPIEIQAELHSSNERIDQLLTKEELSFEEAIVILLHDQAPAKKKKISDTLRQAVDLLKKRKDKSGATGKEPHRGGLILTLGLLGGISIYGLSNLGLCFSLVGLLLSVRAWVMGKADLAKMDQGTMDPAGRKFTKIGKYCGMVVVIIIGVIVIGTFVFGAMKFR
jgi:hypothetical protein